jgi:hypothetical protein
MSNPTTKHAQELAKHAALEKARNDDLTDAVTNRLFKVRQLMKSDPKHNFDSAFSTVCMQENQAAKPMISAEVAPAPPEIKPKGKLRLITGALSIPIWR